MKVNASTLIGAGLNWAVAKSKKYQIYKDGILNGSVHPGFWISGDNEDPDSWTSLKAYSPSTSWSLGGPIIEKEQICICPEAHDGEEGTELSTKWLATIYYSGGEQYTLEDPAPSALIAAMRCYVVSVLGEFIDVPEELLE